MFKSSSSVVLTINNIFFIFQSSFSFQADEEQPQQWLYKCSSPGHL